VRFGGAVSTWGHDVQAWGDHTVLDAFSRTIDDRFGDEPATQGVMKDVRALYALTKLESDMGYLLTEGYLNAGQARAVAVEAAALCRCAAGPFLLGLCLLGLSWALLRCSMPWGTFISLGGCSACRA